jgi:hypothetical protein
VCAHLDGLFPFLLQWVAVAGWQCLIQIYRADCGLSDGVKMTVIGCVLAEIWALKKCVFFFVFFCVCAPGRAVSVPPAVGGSGWVAVSYTVLKP